MKLKRVLLVIAIVAVVLTFLLHRCRQASGGLHAGPQAAGEIEKAKQR